MKTPFESEELLNEVMSPDELRAATLERTLTAARRHRRVRRAAQGAIVVAALLIPATIALRERAPKNPAITENNLQSAPSTQTVPGTNIRIVSDEELLAMFPGRPVALVGPPQDRRFVFLDQQRDSKTHSGPEVLKSAELATRSPNFRLTKKRAV